MSSDEQLKTDRFEGLMLADMQKEFERAEAEGDYGAIYAIEGEARIRVAERWDDTGPDYQVLADKCAEIIRDLIP